MNRPLFNDFASKFLIVFIIGANKWNFGSNEKFVVLFIISENFMPQWPVLNLDTELKQILHSWTIFVVIKKIEYRRSKSED